jgi:hypothetical protein
LSAPFPFHGNLTGIRKNEQKKRDRVSSVSFLKALIKELILQQEQQQVQLRQQQEQRQEQQQEQPVLQEQQQVQRQVPERLLSSVLQLRELSVRSQQMKLSS